MRFTYLCALCACLFYALQAATADDTFDHNLGWIGKQELFVPVQADGTADTVMPDGDTSVTVFGPGYQSTRTVTAPANGLVPFAVSRRNGILIRFVTDNPKGFATCSASVRDGAGNLLGSTSNTIYNTDGCYFHELWNAPPGPYEVRVTRGSAGDACPWTRVDPAVWPNIITVK